MRPRRRWVENIVGSDRDLDLEGTWATNRIERNGMSVAVFVSQPSVYRLY